MIKTQTYLPKIIFKIIENEDINLNMDNISFVDLSFNARYLNDDEPFSSETEWVEIYLKDLDETIIVTFEFSWSFDEKYDPGDYYTPPDYERYNEEIWVSVYDIDTVNYKSDFKIPEMIKTHFRKLDVLIEDYISGCM